VLKDSTISALCANFIKALQQERLERGLSMNALAERAGLSQQMVSYVERGIRKPTFDTVLRIALAMDVDLPRILRRVLKDKPV
jgi:transcriptional regulator with XRE-family HTH domain